MGVFVSTPSTNITKRSRSCSSADATSHHLGSSRSGTSRLRDFHSIEFRPADIPVWLNASRERLLRAPRPLRLRLRCQRGKRCRSASGCVATLHNPRLTDLVHWLQAGKTVDISRCAAKSTDLLTPSALLRQQARLLPGFSTPGLRPPPFRGILLPPAAVACSFSRPPALRRADYRCQSADADLPPVRFPNPCRLRRHPLPGELLASRPVSPVIVLPLWIVMILQVVIGMLDETNRSASAYVVNSVLMVLLSLA